MRRHARWMTMAAAVVVAVALLSPGMERATSAAARIEPVVPVVANPVMVMETERGTIEIELLRGEAPKTVDYIVNLVKKNFYRGLRFHRVERALIQIGDPTSRNVTRQAYWGRTGTTPTVGVAETSPGMKHVRGAVGLAHVGDPRYASSQFYIMKDSSPSLDGKYVIFGRVRSGMSVVDKLKVADVLKLATIKEADPTS